MTVGLAAGAALLLRHSFFESFRVLSPSMLPTLLPFDRLVVNKMAYGFSMPLAASKQGAVSPRRGDVVVFDAPKETRGDGPSQLVKRVIGLPGDEITMLQWPSHHQWLAGPGVRRRHLCLPGEGGRNRRATDGRVP